MPKRTQDQRLWLDLSLDLLSNRLSWTRKAMYRPGRGSLFKETRLALFPEAPKQPKQPQAEPFNPIEALLKN